MRRRAFIAGIGMALLPGGTRAQPQLPVVGFLSPRSPADSRRVLEAFRRGLAELGWVEGRTVTIDYRWAAGDYAQLPVLASGLVQRAAGVIVSVGGEPAAIAAKEATATIPIVSIFTTDPVDSGLVSSISRPSGNVTGVSALNGTLEAKRLGLLRELLPGALRFGVLLNPSFPAAASQLRALQGAAVATGLELLTYNASSEQQIDVAFGSMAGDGVAAAIVAVDTFFVTSRERIVAKAAEHRLPAVYSLRDFPESGGLMSYGVDLTDVYRQAGLYAGRILGGSRPGDLPVVQPTKFEFMLNLKTARTLRLAVPAGVLAIADEVIE